MNEYSDPLKKLIEEFKKMPGIGPKSAQRLAFYILSISKSEAAALSASVLEVKEKIRHCAHCFNLTDKDVCSICDDKSRDRSVICVVEEPKDLIAIEKTGEYKGNYHILGGVISPLDGVSPENLRIKELLQRLGKNNVKEIILALNPSTEGEATVIYLTKLIKPLGIELSRIACGLPIGSDMDYADPVTLIKSIEGRRTIK